MADVFISYCRSAGTSQLVRRIAGELEGRGISCWYDTKSAAPVDFVKRIVTEIDRCKVFLFLWDEKSNANFEERKSYVRREVHRATKKNAELCPFQIGQFEKSPTLEFYFDFINIPYGGDSPETAHTAELVNAIADMLGKPPAPPPKPETPPPAVVPVTQPPPKPQPAPTPKPETPPPAVVPATQAPPKAETPPQPQPAPPAKIVKRGECGDKGGNVTFTLDENGVLTISGKGAMRDFWWDSKTQSRDTPWRDEREKIICAEIQRGVSSIGWGAFAVCAGLKSVTIPDSVSFIGWEAFRGCAGLKSVTIPDSVSFIGDWAFDGCANLKSVTIPDSVSSIGRWAFRGCDELKSASVPAKAEIAGNAFPGWTRIERRGA